MEFRDLFLKQKEAIRKRTQQVVGMLKPEHMAWRPESGALTIGEMIRHLWVSEEGVRRVALDGNFDYYETRIPQGLRAVLGTPQGLNEELKNLSRVHLETLGLVSKRPAPFFDEERIHEGFGFRRKVYTILLGMNEHEIHHRAQLMTYLRILGTPVPEAINRR